MDLERLPELLRETVGPRARVAAIESLKWRQDYTVLLVNVEQPETRVVVELAGPKAELACPFERTAQLHRLVASRTGLDMPEILGVDTSYGRYPWRYLVKTHIAGVEWVQVRQQMSARERAHAFWQLGHVLAELHYIIAEVFISTISGIHLPVCDGAGQAARAARLPLGERRVGDAPAGGSGVLSFVGGVAEVAGAGGVHHAGCWPVAVSAGLFDVDQRHVSESLWGPKNRLRGAR